MKAVVAAFNQEKALVGAFSVIVQLHRWINVRHKNRNVLSAVSGCITCVSVCRSKLQKCQLFSIKVHQIAAEAGDPDPDCCDSGP